MLVAWPAVLIYDWLTEGSNRRTRASRCVLPLSKDGEKGRIKKEKENKEYRALKMPPRPSVDPRGSDEYTYNEYTIFFPPPLPSSPMVCKYRAISWISERTCSPSYVCQVCWSGASSHATGRGFWSPGFTGSSTVYQLITLLGLCWIMNRVWSGYLGCLSCCWCFGSRRKMNDPNLLGLYICSRATGS